MRTMARSALVAGLGSLTLAAASPAQAEIVDAFRKLCLDNDGRAERVADLAYGMGWMLTPPTAVANYGNAGDYRAGFVPPGANPGHDMIGVANVTPKVPQGVDSVFTLCVATGEHRADALQEKLTPVLGKPFINAQGFAVWMYSRKDGAMVPETTLYNSSEDAIREVWRVRTTYIVTIIREPNGIGSIMLMTARRPGE